MPQVRCDPVRDDGVPGKGEMRQGDGVAAVSLADITRAGIGVGQIDVFEAAEHIQRARFM
jgi:hypothetical protein